MAFRRCVVIEFGLRVANIAIAGNHLHCMFFLDKLDLPVFIVLERINYASLTKPIKSFFGNGKDFIAKPRTVLRMR